MPIEIRDQIYYYAVDEITPRSCEAKVKSILPFRFGGGWYNARWIEGQLDLWFAAVSLVSRHFALEIRKTFWRQCALTIAEEAPCCALDDTFLISFKKFLHMLGPEAKELRRLRVRCRIPTEPVTIRTDCERAMEDCVPFLHRSCIVHLELQRMDWGKSWKRCHVRCHILKDNRVKAVGCALNLEDWEGRR